MKRKNSKKSGIIAAVVGLSSVSLVSVGFASWIMSGGDSLDLTGQISVDTVSDQRYFIHNKSSVTVNYGTDKNNAAASKIVYGIDTTSGSFDDPWLKANSTAANNKYENLTATVEIWVANISASATNIGAEITPTSSNSDSRTGYYAALDHGYVGALPAVDPNHVADGTTGITIVVGNDTNQFETSSSEDPITFRKVTISVTFKWGSHFGGGNPYAYYNAKTMSGYVDSVNNTGPTWGDDARTSLLGLEKDLNGVGFTLRITTRVPNN